MASDRSALPLVRTGPRTGDVVVRFQHDSTATCILSVHPGPQQLRCVSRGDALDLARRFAAREHVDCWTTTDGRTFGLDLEHRPP